jgi:hypothetical protein
MASAALVTAMMAQGIRVRLNILDTWHYVAPLEDIGPNRLHELLQDSEFKYLAVVTFLTASPGSLLTFNVPGNWNSGNNKAETIAAGGSGSAISVSDPIGGTIVGGAGGAYSAQTNTVLVPGSTAQYQIGTGGAAVTASFESNKSGNAGGDSWFNGATLGASSVGAKGRPWGDRSWQDMWRKMARAAGIPDNIQNRDSRPGAATEADLAGADEKKVQRGLGHARGETTRRYLREDLEVNRELARLRTEKRKP